MLLVLLVVALGTFALLVVVTTWAAADPSGRAGLAVLGSAGLWVVFNGPVEGPTLLVLDRTHGLTVADLACPLAGLVFLISLMRRRRQDARQGAGTTSGARHRRQVQAVRAARTAALAVLPFILGLGVARY